MSQQRKNVLCIGIEPSLVDFSSMPELDEAKVSAGLKSSLEDLTEHGYRASWCLVDLGETAEAVVAKELAQPYDCVLIGAGVRAIPDYLPLFEKLINVVHAHAPSAKICFNTRPTDTLAAVARWI